MLPIVALIVLVLIVLGAVIMMQPGDFRVERTVAISAPAATIFPLINDFHKWETWSPWEKVDPNVKRAYSGAPAGVGAIYEWSGNAKLGAGRMTIIESKPNELMRFKMEFFKPMKSTSTGEFTLKSEGGQTLVTQVMFGPKNFVSKAVCMVMNMENMIGPQFEKGLADLKAIAEAA